MMLWISEPSVIIPEPSDHEHSIDVDPLYRRIYQAFSVLPDEVNENGFWLPRARIDRETMATAAIAPILGYYQSDQKPDILVDCHSSAAIGGPAPCYKLASLCGLTRIMPFSLSGQYGTEVVYAFLFLRTMLIDTTKTCLISTTQRIVKPDKRLREGWFPLGDAAGAIAVASSPIIPNPAFRILGVSISQDSQEWLDLITTTFDDVLIQSGLGRNDVQWAIAHRCTEPFLDAAKSILPSVAWLVRDVFPSVDFGSVDPLVSLFTISQMASFPGVGVVWFAGRFGSVGAILLERA